MRVAGGVCACWLIFDRSNNAENSRASGVAVNAKPVRTVHSCQWLRLRVARVTCFSGLIDDVILFGRISCIRDPPFLVEDPDLFHSRLGGHGLNRPVKPFSVVPQHVVRGAMLDYVAYSFRAQQRVLLQMLPVQPDIEVSQQGEDRHHRAEQEDVQLGAQAASQPEPADPMWISLRHVPAPAIVAAPPPPVVPAAPPGSVLRERSANTSLPGRTAR